jgi:hypothetical protein
MAEVTFEQPVWNFEESPWNEERDETSINLRAYMDRIPDEKFRQYDPAWSDEQVMEWDGNFTEEGELLIACSERAVDVAEFRRVLHQAVEYRNQARPALQAAGRI